METSRTTTQGQAGFTLIELMIAMTLTLVIAGISSTLLSQSFRMRAREDTRSDAIADAQRALNIVSREIANSGFGLVDNGIVPGDTDNTSIRIRANLNAYRDEPSNDEVSDPDEDIKYLMYNDDAENRHYLVRFDAEVAKTDRAKATTVLANRLDSFQLEYFDSAGAPISVTATPTNVVNAWKVRITVGVNLPEDGTEGSPGYQPASTVQLVSDVVLRNVSQVTY
jgi:prepilin-type N-terminal cleavage/methylation domain-containing protein